MGINLQKNFKLDLKANKPLIGTVISFNSTEVIELLSNCGFDWLWIDAEHGTYSTSDLQSMLQATNANVSCLIRVANSNIVEIKKALDLGPAGIIVPMVNDKEQAEMVVQFAKYPTIGSRGVGLARAHGYGLKFDEYMKNANTTTAIVIQIEHIEAVENIESIMQVDDIDAIMLGPYDLSASMGLMGEVDHPEVVKAIDHVIDIAKEADKAIGIFCGSNDAAKKYINKGCSLVAISTDSLMLGNVAVQAVESFKK